MVSAASQPTEPFDRGVSEDRSATYPRQGHRTELPAVRALLGLVPEKGAAVAVDRRDALEDEPNGEAWIDREHDVPHSVRSAERRNDQPVAITECRLHASARDGDALEERYARAAAFATRVACGPPAFVHTSAILSIMSRSVLASPMSSEPFTLEHCFAAFQHSSVISGYF